jgi:proteasome lid subunit RPN8/RPN11
MFELDRVTFDDMVEHGLAVFPNEACGLLAGKEGRPVKFFPMTNQDASPVSYSLEPKEQIEVDKQMEAEGLELFAIFHTHTHSEAYPSETDLERAPTWFYPNVYYLVMSLSDRSNPVLRGFRMGDGSIDEEELQIA